MLFLCFLPALSSVQINH